MNRRNILAIAAATGLGLSLLSSTACAQQSDTDKIKATIDDFHAAISSLDIRKMDDLWAHEPYVMVINPRDKGVSVGWDAVRKNWETVFNFWTDLKVTKTDGPHIHINGGLAWADGIAVVAGKPKTGEPISNAPTLETGILEKRGDRWLVVSWSAWRAPQ
jgi:ketosteroid isomerase-like protein